MKGGVESLASTRVIPQILKYRDNPVRSLLTVLKNGLQMFFSSQDYIYIINGSYCLSSQCYWIEKVFIGPVIWP